MINKNNQIKSILATSSTISKDKQSYFFKTSAGSYAEHDQFIGVPVPTLRTIAKDFLDLSQDEITRLLESAINEERFLGLIILVHQYQKAKDSHKEELYQFYMDNLTSVNNWNLVDASAHLILGAHVFNKNRDILVSLAQSAILWERRIAMVATWYFIRKNDLTWTFKIATLRMN